MSANGFLRHGRATRVLHAGNALVIGILLVTGLALGDIIPDSAAWMLGGHLRISATHQWLGLAFAIALVALVSIAPRRTRRWLHDICHMRRSDWRWPLAFLRFFAAPRRYAPPFHDGRFDPLQRIVFAGIALTITALAATGAYLYFWTPAFPLGQWSLGYAIRIHIATAWTLIACLVLHTVAGSGVLWTHRGITNAMFGDGCVSAMLAQNLWPTTTRGEVDRAKNVAKRTAPP